MSVSFKFMIGPWKKFRRLKKLLLASSYDTTVDREEITFKLIVG